VFFKTACPHAVRSRQISTGPKLLIRRSGINSGQPSLRNNVWNEAATATPLDVSRTEAASTTYPQPAIPSRLPPHFAKYCLVYYEAPAAFEKAAQRGVLKVLLDV